MAGIEKVCEVCQHTPPNMYEFKRDSIQVDPQCRRLFRNQPHTLYIFASEDEVGYIFGSPQIDYCLYVPSIPGHVNGLYLNWSVDMSTVKRKLKRLLRARKLNIVYVDITIRAAVKTDMMMECGDHRISIGC